MKANIFCHPLKYVAKTPMHIIIGSLTEITILARPIKMYAVLEWDRNSYRTHVFILRLSHEDCTLVLLGPRHMVIKYIVVSK